MFDLIEVTIKMQPRKAEEHRECFNSILRGDNTAYRVVGDCVVPVSDETEVDVLESVGGIPDAFSGARMHLDTAIERLSDKPAPDLRNAVKEAISAVESAARVIIGDEKATLGKAIKKIESDHGLHPALASAWSQIYGFTSNSDGIRHGAVDGEVALDYPLAKYLVISCVTFVNYLIALDVDSAR